MFKVFFLFVLIAVAYCAPVDKEDTKPVKELTGAETVYLNNGYGGWGNGWGRGYGAYNGYGGWGNQWGRGYGVPYGGYAGYAGYPAYGHYW